MKVTTNINGWALLIITEAINNGLSTSVVQFEYRFQADQAMQAIEAAPQVDGQLVRAIRLYE